MHPVLFDFGVMKIYTYGFFVAAAMTACFFTAARLAKRLGFRPEDVYDLILVIFLCGVIGSRLAYVLQNWDIYAKNPAEAFWIKEGGLVWYGGFILAALAAFLYAGIKKLPKLDTADLLTPLLALGHSIGRIGCFLNGCCYGRVTTSWFGVIFLSGESKRWPVQIFESIFLFVLFWVLLAMILKKHKPGMVFAAYLFSYSIWRFAIEFIRDDQAMIGIFTVAQWISIALFKVSLVLFIILSRRHAER